MAQIEIYKDVNFGGRSVSLNEDVENLKNYGFNDEVSSCKVISGTWILYKDANFQGDSSILSKGNYQTPSAMNFPNDSLSSLRHFPDVSGPTILLFADINYRGRMVTLTGADSNLGSIDFNDSASSAIVLNGTWILYKDYDFKGTRWVLSSSGGDKKDGRYPLPNYFDNDAISSAQPERTIDNEL